MTLYRGYEPAANKCSGKASEGSKEFMSWFLGAYGKLGGRNLGIYNCRSIAGTSVPSVHGEGRACDCGTPVGNKWSWALAEFLRLHSKELGIQLIIHRGKVWSGSNADAGWRDYLGKNPHNDHIHVEFSKHAARTLTAVYIQTVVSGIVTHVVRAGDTLWDIAEDYLGSGSLFKRISDANGVKGTTIYPGQRLTIPQARIPSDGAQRVHVVQRGDTLWALAGRYLGSPWRHAEIAKLNGLHDSDIYPGQRLRIPPTVN